MILLGLILVCTILFKGGGKTASDFSDLELKNDSLLKENTELKHQKDSIDIHIKYLEKLAADKVIEINKATDKINKLNKNKDEISNYVDSLPNDSIATAFTKYLERRTGKNVH